MESVISSVFNPTSQAGCVHVTHVRVCETYAFGGLTTPWAPKEPPAALFLPQSHQIVCFVLIAL